MIILEWGLGHHKKEFLNWDQENICLVTVKINGNLVLSLKLGELFGYRTHKEKIFGDKSMISEH